MKIRSFIYFCYVYFIQAVASADDSTEKTDHESKSKTDGDIEYIVVSANRQVQNLYQVSASVSVVYAEELDKNGIIDLRQLENVIPGFRGGFSGSEARPALRGARTNEVGVAATGIAEQVLGIFQDGVYLGTTTAALGTYVDLNRIEVLHGPQGTLYGRNTFAGSINLIANQPDMDALSFYGNLSLGDYNDQRLQAVINLPFNQELASRFVFSRHTHDGYIDNLDQSVANNDLRDKQTHYLRMITKYDNREDMTVSLRIDHHNKNANSEAIWGYQQIVGYQLQESAPNSGIFLPNALIRQGHIYQPENAENDDRGPYEVSRNSVSFDQQESTAATLNASLQLDNTVLQFISNFTKLSGKQFYDNDYSDGGFDVVGGFGRQDDHYTRSLEMVARDAGKSAFDWLVGVYWFNQDADWEWLWREDTDSDMLPDTIVVPSWGNPLNDPHRVKSQGLFSQIKLPINERSALTIGLRYNRDNKNFTNNSQAWQDSALLWKTVFEYNIQPNMMTYLSAATGYRTGGANDARVVNLGASPFYNNEEVISYEMGLKSIFSQSLRFNFSLYYNEYSDVKAQLFAIACNDNTTGESVLECVDSGNSTTFEYYENGGNSTTLGLEGNLEWLVSDSLTISTSLALMRARFDDEFAVGNSQLRPLLGLGNFQNRQDVNDANSQFSFAGWDLAMSPAYVFGIGLDYVYQLESGSFLNPYLHINFVDDYFAFDTNIPEVKVDAHAMVNGHLAWELSDRFTVQAFVNNLTNETVLVRAVVHSQIVGGLPVNSIQANWNDPRTFGIGLSYRFD